METLLTTSDKIGMRTYDCFLWCKCYLKSQGGTCEKIEMAQNEDTLKTLDLSY